MAGWPGPDSPAQMDQLRQFSELPTTCDYLRASPLFGPVMRADLVQMLGGNHDAAWLIEVQCWIGSYHDASACRQLDRDVWRRLARDGVRRPRGKRTRPELVDMVRDLVGLLQALGVPLKREKGAPMSATILKVLEVVHAELQMDGDPRNEYRRLLRLERERAEAKKLAAEIYRDAFRRGLSFDDDPEPPVTP